MTQQAGKSKAGLFLRAIADLVIIGLLITGAAFGGYFWGTHQRLAPIADVPPGTPGAISPAGLPPPVSHSGSGGQASNSVTDAGGSQPQRRQKYWISSSGSDYIGYSITVKVNDTPVDSFFGPGKTVNITHLVKPGSNTVAFEAKALGSDYNKHSGDAASVLTVQVVGGPTVQENFKQSDVLATYSRNAEDSGDNSESAHFSGD